MCWLACVLWCNTPAEWFTTMQVCWLGLCRFAMFGLPCTMIVYLDWLPSRCNVLLINLCHDTYLCGSPLYREAMLADQLGLCGDTIIADWLTPWCYVLQISSHHDSLYVDWVKPWYNGSVVCDLGCNGVLLYHRQNIGQIMHKQTFIYYLSNNL